MEASSRYRCAWNGCNFEGLKREAINHVIKEHAPIHTVPFYCTLCGFKCLHLQSLQRHVTSWKNHMTMSSGSQKDDVDSLCSSNTPYNVTWGPVDDGKVDLVMFQPNQSRNFGSAPQNFNPQQQFGNVRFTGAANLPASIPTARIQGSVTQPQNVFSHLQGVQASAGAQPWGAGVGVQGGQQGLQPPGLTPGFQNALQAMGTPQQNAASMMGLLANQQLLAQAAGLVATPGLGMQVPFAGPGILGAGPIRGQMPQMFSNVGQSGLNKNGQFSPNTDMNQRGSRMSNQNHGHQSRVRESNKDQRSNERSRSDSKDRHSQNRDRGKWEDKKNVQRDDRYDDRRDNRKIDRSIDNKDFRRGDQRDNKNTGRYDDFERVGTGRQNIRSDDRRDDQRDIRRDDRRGDLRDVRREDRREDKKNVQRSDRDFDYGSDRREIRKDDRLMGRKDDRRDDGKEKRRIYDDRKDGRGDNRDSRSRGDADRSRDYERNRSNRDGNKSDRNSSPDRKRLKGKDGAKPTSSKSRYNEQDATSDIDEGSNIFDEIEEEIPAWLRCSPSDLYFNRDNTMFKDTTLVYACVGGRDLHIGLECDEFHLVPGAIVSQLTVEALQRASQIPGHKTVYFIAGIPDLLTTLTSPGYEETIFEDRNLYDSLYGQMRQTDMALKQQNCHVVFSTISSMSLKDYNENNKKIGKTYTLRFEKKYPEMQENLHRLLKKINRSIASINTNQKLLTPLIHSHIIKRSSEKNKIAYRLDKLLDGLNPCGTVVDGWRNTVNKTILRNKIMMSKPDFLRNM